VSSGNTVTATTVLLTAVMTIGPGIVSAGVATEAVGAGVETPGVNRLQEVRSKERLRRKMERVFM